MFGFFWGSIPIFFQCFPVVVFWGGRILLVVRGCGIHANCKWLVLHRKWYSKTCILVNIGQVRVEVVEDEGSGMEHCENVHICMEHIHIEVIGSDNSQNSTQCHTFSIKQGRTVPRPLQRQCGQGWQ